MQCNAAYRLSNALKKNIMKRNYNWFLEQNCNCMKNVDVACDGISIPFRSVYVWNISYGCTNEAITMNSYKRLMWNGEDFFLFLFCISLLSSSSSYSEALAGIFCRWKRLMSHFCWIYWKLIKKFFFRVKFVFVLVFGDCGIFITENWFFFSCTELLQVPREMSKRFIDWVM